MDIINKILIWFFLHPDQAVLVCVGGLVLGVVMLVFLIIKWKDI